VQVPKRWEDTEFDVAGGDGGEKVVDQVNALGYDSMSAVKVPGATVDA
jgi:hypothetical protein